MTSHPTDHQLQQYRLARLPPAEQLGVDDHLAECPSCRQRALEGSSLRSAVSSLREDLQAHSTPAAHASFEELAAYADGGLDDVHREVLEEHLEACAVCAAEAGDLQQLSKDPPPAPARGPNLRTAAGLAAAALAAGLAAWVVILPLRSEVRRLQAEQDRLARSTRHVQEETAALRATADALESELQGLERRVGAAPLRPRIALRDASGAVLLDEQGRVQGLGALPGSLEERVRGALWTRRVKVPLSAVALAASRGRLRGPESPSSFQVMSPIGTSVESDRPTFRWQPLEGATSYKVTVSDADLREVAASPALSTTQWTPAAPLPRGRSYVWQVAAQAQGREALAPQAPEPEARFRILDTETARGLDRARKGPASHLLLGVLYAEAGLVEQAQHELQALLALNPGSALAADLLRSLGSAPPVNGRPTL